MSIIHRALGLLAPGFRTVRQWSIEYDKMMATLPISPLTLRNRRCNVRHILESIGGRPIRNVRPLEIAQLVRRIWDSGRPFAARGALLESGRMFAEAVLSGWIDKNPADPVRALPWRVSRSRLSFEQWQATLAWSIANGQPWEPHSIRLALVTGQRRSDLATMGLADVWDDHLHITQQKTGARVALPLDLTLHAAGLSLRQVITDCTDYAPAGKTFIRCRDGSPLTPASLTVRFQEAREAACGPWLDDGTPPTLHECRSLAERLYRAQGVDTKTLLGHKRQSMTDAYNDERGLSKNDYKRLVL